MITAAKALNSVAFFCYKELTKYDIRIDNLISNRSDCGYTECKFIESTMTKEQYNHIVKTLKDRGFKVTGDFRKKTIVIRW